MKSSIISLLIEKQADKNLTSEELVSKFSYRVKRESKNEIDKSLSELLLILDKRYNLKIDGIEKSNLLFNSIMVVINNHFNSMNLSISQNSFESIYEKTSIEALKLLKKQPEFTFDLIDNDALESLKEGFMFLKTATSDMLVEKAKAVVSEVLEGKIPIDEAGNTLRERFSDLSEKISTYYQAVVEHNVRQNQNIARANQYSKHNVPFVKVMAKMDEKTSPVCRSLNGRIIATSHIERQAKMIQDARSIKEKKEASFWSNKPILDRDLPKNIGLPPYHFKCRTILTPYYPDEGEIVDGEKADGSLKSGDKFNNKEVLFSHKDRTGVERVATKNTLEHSDTSRERNTPPKEIIKALNSINAMGEHSENKERFIAKSNNGYFLVFEGQEIITCFKPSSNNANSAKKQLEKYYQKFCKTNTSQIIKSSWIKRITNLLKGIKI